MRPTQIRRGLAVPSLFVSCKSEIAIPIRQPLLRYALEQAALEPSVRTIRYRTGPDIECPHVSLHGVVLDRVDGNFLLQVFDHRPERSKDELARVRFALECHGLRLLERDAKDIRREPLFSNARAVWSHAKCRVSLPDRLRIAIALEDGPQSIVELEERTRSTCDILAAVCALACEDVVRLNIDVVPLGPRTTVIGSIP
ncbi:hypothetical protein GPL21_06945 [Bradyrhizobium pachyrhizi]|uniref:TnsA endonuclease N-terminal domain-containing protein n=1 Tax=Bradyrhizobium pachyrhizi TaxID=280333 RepID=A0A844SN57_9BRAD|nr:hypothetical protein [Bradyrhizobium pachyrhizi]MVT64842.1 hypothetical protein [Bradyrhizobium pachyrhizi]